SISRACSLVSDTCFRDQRPAIGDQFLSYLSREDSKTGGLEDSLKPGTDSLTEARRCREICRFPKRRKNWRGRGPDRLPPAPPPLSFVSIRCKELVRPGFVSIDSIGVRLRPGARSVEARQPSKMEREGGREMTVGASRCTIVSKRYYINTLSNRFS